MESNKSNESNNKPINFTIDAELHARFKAKCAMLGKPMSQVLQILVSKFSEESV